MTRKFFQVALPIIIVIGMVGTVAHMSQYTPTVVSKQNKSKAGDTDGPALEFPTLTADWERDKPPNLIALEKILDANNKEFANALRARIESAKANRGSEDDIAKWEEQLSSIPTSMKIPYNKEFELGTRGYYDFWAVNKHRSPVQVVLLKKSCTCGDVELGVIDADALAAVVKSMPATATAASAFGPLGFDPHGPAIAAMMRDIKWQPLVVSGKIGSIPPADPPTGQTVAVIRLKWEAKNEGPLRYAADISYVGGGERREIKQLMVPLVVVSPLRAAPEQILLGDIRPGDVMKYEIILWSSTRDQAPLTLPDLGADPCVKLGPAEPIDALDCARRLQTAMPGMPPPAIRCAYRVPLVIHERLGDYQLDLGPFRRTLLFNAGTEFKAAVPVTGRVRGDISLDTKNEEDVIRLGDFQADRPRSEKVSISAPPGMKLRIVSRAPDFIEATLEEPKGIGSTWDLRLVIPANSVAGSIPAGSHVLIETVGPNPRRFRIPILGTAYVR